MRRNVLIGSLIIVVLAAVTAAVVLRDQSLPELLASLTVPKPIFLLLGLILMTAFVSCEALSTRMLLRAMGNAPRMRACIGYAFAGFYFSAVTPLSAGGQPMQVYYMSRDGIPSAHGALVMLLDSVFYQVVTVLYALAALLLFPFLVEQLGLGLWALLALGTVCLTLMSGLFLAFLFRPVLAQRLAEGVLMLLYKLRIVRNLPARRAKLARLVSDYRQGAALLQHRPGILPAMLCLNTVQLTFLYLIPMVVYRAFGLSGAPYIQMVATQALLSLAVVCLPLPGAVGAAEGVFLRGFTLFFGSALVTPAMIVVRSINFYLFILLSGGITAVVHLRGRRRSAAHQPIDDNQRAQ